MRGKKYFISAILIVHLLFCSGCTNSKNVSAIISANSGSEHMNTFKTLDLGILWDFNLKLNNADNTWISVWIESYKDGKQEPQRIAELSYGVSSNKVEEGNIGFGIITTEDTPFVFLYSPNASITPKKIDVIQPIDAFSQWSYAIDKENLKLGETYLLGLYRESNHDYIRTYNLQDEGEVRKMIHDSSLAFLIKLKIEEK